MFICENYKFVIGGDVCEETSTESDFEDKTMKVDFAHSTRSSDTVRPEARSRGTWKRAMLDAPCDH